MTKKIKDDEYYTQLKDIEEELQYYVKNFENKIIYMNCDNPDVSMFWKYFYDNFNTFKLKKIISTYYNKEGKTYKTEYNGKNITKEILKENGDFRNNECIEILKSADIIITNPPFSVFSSFLDLLLQYNKKFIIMGPVLSISIDRFFWKIVEGKLNIGTNPNKQYEFIRPTGELTSVNCVWFSNVPFEKKKEEKKEEKVFYKYDNRCDVINIDKSKDIPKDYNGLMGVPITFIYTYNPEEFEIVDLFKNPIVNNKEKFKRIIIKRKQ